MEDVYSIRVKTKPDTRNLYPSERRYSASTVSGLAWVHIALGSTSFLLACLALVNPNEESTEFNTSFNSTNVNTTTVSQNYILVLAPSLLTLVALLAGAISILASIKWYIDRNITWLFVASLLATVVSFISFVMVTIWFVTTSEENISEFYKDRDPFKDFIVVKHSDVIDRNESHLIIPKQSETVDEHSLFTKRVLSINILIAAFLELLWSMLSVKISYKGMRNNYKDESNERRGNCISVVTTVKGNTKKLPRNGKLIPPKPDLINHYPSDKIKRIFLAQSDNGFYLKNQNNKTKQNTETSSEFYKERMMNFLNRCASLEAYSNPELGTPSVQSESVLNAIPEMTTVELNNLQDEIRKNDTVTPLSWGDTPDHTIYNQNTLNLDNIFNFGAKKTQDGGKESENKEASENQSD